MPALPPAVTVPVDKALRVPGVKPVIFLVCLLPLGLLIHGAVTQQLGANPTEAMNRGLGDWALRFLLITLAVTPLHRLFGLASAMRYRRMLGLYAFFYAALHILSYTVIDQGLDWPEIWKDLVKRQYITIGMITFLMLVPLAVTSTKGWIKRLGGPRWNTLHKLVYPATILAIAHYTMMIKADYLLPGVHAAILAVLLGLRLYWRAERKAKRARRRKAA